VPKVCIHSVLAQGEATKDNQMANARKFLNHVHYFRGFAIVNIAMAHIWHFPGEFRHKPEAEWILILREVLFHGSSAYFLFISGFLLFYLSNRIKGWKYLKNKFFFVILPFLSMTLVATCLRLLIETPEAELTASFAIRLFLDGVISGNAQVQYWYIPFIIPIFLISPLLLKIPKDAFKIICAILLFVPILGSRTGTTIGVGLYAYFFPVYLLGMFTAMDYPRFLSKIKHRSKYLHFLFFTSSIILILLYRGIIEKPSHGIIINTTESLFYIQKVSFCFLSLIFLETLEKKHLPIMEKLAEYSFAIFFTHTFVFHFLNNLFFLKTFEFFPSFLLPLSILFAAVVLLTNLLLCMAAKNVLGTKSRYLIGA
jgi:peptidoglycan/LPS O-acetylase OafA/YrhL